MKWQTMMMMMMMMIIIIIIYYYYYFCQDWEELCRAQKYDFRSYVSVDHHVATNNVETVEELCEASGSARSVEEEDEEDENEQEMVSSFAETYDTLQKVKSIFLCAKWKRRRP